MRCSTKRKVYHLNDDVLTVNDKVHAERRVLVQYLSGLGEPAEGAQGTIRSVLVRGVCCWAGVRAGLTTLSQSRPGRGRTCRAAACPGEQGVPGRWGRWACGRLGRRGRGGGKRSARHTRVAQRHTLDDARGPWRCRQRSGARGLLAATAREQAWDWQIT